MFAAFIESTLSWCLEAQRCGSVGLFQLLLVSACAITMASPFRLTAVNCWVPLSAADQPSDSAATQRAARAQRFLEEVDDNLRFPRGCGDIEGSSTHPEVRMLFQSLFCIRCLAAQVRGCGAAWHPQPGDLWRRDDAKEPVPP